MSAYVAGLQAALACLTGDVVRASGYRPDAPSLSVLLAGGAVVALRGTMPSLGVRLRQHYRLVEDRKAPSRRRWWAHLLPTLAHTRPSGQKRTALMAMRSESESISAEQRICGAAAAACRDACREAIEYCLRERGDAEDAAHMRLLRECAEQCARTADTLQHHADADGRLTAATRDLAGRTMRELSESFPEDERLQACADACLRVAERCLSATAPSASQDEVSDESFPASDPPPH